jgi:large subunit ribosomal protein L35
MSKLKTNSGAKKRFRQRADGTIIHKASGRRHGLRRKSTKVKRNLRGSFVLDQADKKHVMRCIGYGL